MYTVSPPGNLDLAPLDHSSPNYNGSTAIHSTDKPHPGIQCFAGHCMHLVFFYFDVDHFKVLIEFVMTLLLFCVLVSLAMRHVGS